MFPEVPHRQGVIEMNALFTQAIEQAISQYLNDNSFLGYTEFEVVDISYMDLQRYKPYYSDFEKTTLLLNVLVKHAPVKRKVADTEYTANMTAYLVFISMDAGSIEVKWNGFANDTLTAKGKHDIENQSIGFDVFETDEYGREHYMGASTELGTEWVKQVECKLNQD